ncbi:MAG: N-acetylmuramidase domain-containing protein [Hyphomonadaceae bacterium]|nr:N-acetylmuramidase domain-containing protein [Hyphomonadaceae bacterium]
MADVFLSYKREDRGRAKVISDAIEKHGFSVFFDAEIDVGEAWNARIERELNAAKCVVVLWSERSAPSHTGEWVHNEARKGKALQILAPALIDTCEIPLEFSSVQAADLRDWRGDASETEWRRFIERVGECVGRGPQKRAAQPWRRRWVRIAAAVAVIVGIGALAAVNRDRLPWNTAPASTSPGASPGGGPVGGGVVDVSAIPATPEEVLRLLQYSMQAGECDALNEDIEAARPIYPGVAAVEGALRRQCARNAADREEIAPGDAPPIVVAPPPATPVSQDFIASLVARDRSPLSRADFEAVAAQLGVEWQALAAVAQVESGPLGGFAADGRMIILFERHLFSRKTNGRFDASHPHLSNRTPGGYPRTQADRWAQLREAYALDPEAALESASYGRFQTLGQNFATMGVANAREYVALLARSERDQLAAFAAYVRANGLVDEMQNQDWEGFARRVHGTAYAQQRIPERMAEAFARLSAE